MGKIPTETIEHLREQKRQAELQEKEEQREREEEQRRNREEGERDGRAWALTEGTYECLKNIAGDELPLSFRTWLPNSITHLGSRGRNYLDGFQEGACQVWQEIKDQL